MQRRSFLFFYIVFVGLTLIPQVALSEPITLSYANSPPNTTFPSVQMERWVAEVEKRTGGAVRFETYPDSRLLSATAMYDGVKKGKADIGCVAIACAATGDPLCSLFELPLRFQTAEVASATFWDVFMAHHKDDYQGLKVLTVFTSGPSCIMSKTPVTTLDALQGLEIRSIGNGLMLLDKLGAIPVALPISETGDALYSGKVKGVFSSLELLMDLNFAEYCRYETLTNIHVYPFMVIMNRKSWQLLPKNAQKVIEEISREHAVWTGRYVDERIRRAVRWAKARYGINIYKLSDADMAKAQAIFDTIIQTWRQRYEDQGIPVEQYIIDLNHFRVRNRAQVTSDEPIQMSNN